MKLFKSSFYILEGVVLKSPPAVIVGCCSFISKSLSFYIHFTGLHFVMDQSFSPPILTMVECTVIKRVYRRLYHFSAIPFRQGFPIYGAFAQESSRKTLNLPCHMN